MSEIGFISCRNQSWHTDPYWAGTQPGHYWAHHDNLIGALRVNEQDSTQWVYAIPNKDGALQTNMVKVGDGFALETEDGFRVCRSGDWVVLKAPWEWMHDVENSYFDEWQPVPGIERAIYVSYRGVDKWLCVKQNGELNVKCQGEYAILWHNNRFSL